MGNNIYLTGYRCTGKTTVGRILAERMHRHVVDTDGFIVGYAGASVDEIVKRDGWEGFRKLERFALRQVAGGDKAVVATGGGIVLSPENRRLMRESGVVIWLKARVRTLARRITADEATASQRPSLTGGQVADEVASVLAEREPLYREAAHIIIDTDGMSPDEVAEEILRQVKDA
ncbi:shikimate kinase AroL [Desulfoluna butyratoxydans]|uniref:Shikimate kinase n=1 Tax=Desulfoluna butyratoxydans TaxID=231438 RepID=A0A4U8YN50_9BACT|nr:shikimate kinase AroL [Desulfoluna butyratoxydans]VFQ44957.1 shikimate kinase/gluconokinase [Desulfoluna butyratoxydans]